MSGSSRQCGTCRWFKDAGMGGTGWCTHPERQTSSDVRILVRKAELACRNPWGDDYWEPLDSATNTQSEPEPTEPDDTNDTPLHISYEDEVTSVVDSDIHRAQTREDLNDRVVNQSSLDPDDEDSGDDRFGLLARGGRDSVSEARNRILRRRGGQQDPSEEEAEDPSSETGQVEFPPDDFVEDEGPARHEEASSSGSSAHDDVVISENVPQGTPRSRRLRREHDRQSPPKDEANAGTSPDVTVKATGATDSTVGDAFNTVPEISSNIDISKLRRHHDRRDDESRPEPQDRADEPGEDAFERAISSARAIRAAARSERQERHRQAQRPQIRPRTSEPVAEQEVDASDTIAQLAQSAIARQQTAEPSQAPSEPAPRRHRMSTRELETDAPRDNPPQHITMQAPTPSRHDDPSTSWWRGMFRQREKAPRAEQQLEYDDYVVTEDKQDVDVTTTSTDWHDDPLPELFDSEDDYLLSENDQDLNESPDSDLYDRWTEPVEEAPHVDAGYEPIDLDEESGMESFRTRLFKRAPSSEDHGRPAPAAPLRREPEIAAADLLESPADAWYEPEPEPGFDIRHIVENGPALLDMTIEIAPDVPRQCATCRSYRQSEQGMRGWCTNNWAFTHRQMVNATDLACQSAIGCWWLPADEEVWLDTSEPERGRTPRIDRLIAHLDPLKKAVGR